MDFPLAEMIRWFGSTLNLTFHGPCLNDFVVIVDRLIKD